MANIVWLWSVLDRASRKSFVACLFLGLAGSVLEMFSVGILLPTLYLISGYRFENAPRVMREITEAIDLSGLGDPFVYGILLISAMFLLKAVGLTFISAKHAEFAGSVQNKFSQRMFDGYVQLHYEAYLGKNSSEMVRNTSEEIRILVGCFVVPSLLLLSEFCTFAAIVLLLAYIEPQVTLGVLAFSVVGLTLLYRPLQKVLQKLGNERMTFEGERIRHVQQAVGSIREIKLRGCETLFSVEYQKPNSRVARAYSRLLALQQLPRIWLECFAVVLILVLGLLLFRQGRPGIEIIALLSVYIAAAFRILPTFNRITVSLQSIRFALPAIRNIQSELKRFHTLAQPFTARRASPSLHQRFAKEITFEDVSYRYPGSDHDVLRRVNFTIEKAACVGFIGKSGAGKTTLVDLMLGLLSPKTGRILVDGLDVFQDLRSWRQTIGYVPQKIYLLDDTLRRSIAFGVKDEDIDEVRINDALSIAQLDAWAKSLPHGLDTRVGERGQMLSGGQIQRIAIARAMYHSPEVLILDEPTSALDVNTEKNLMEAIECHSRTRTVIIIAHRMSTIEQCDTVYRIDGGELVRLKSVEQAVSRARLS